MHFSDQIARIQKLGGTEVAIPPCDREARILESSEALFLLRWLFGRAAPWASVRRCRSPPCQKPCKAITVKLSSSTSTPSDRIYQVVVRSSRKRTRTFRLLPLRSEDPTVGWSWFRGMWFPSPRFTFPPLEIANGGSDHRRMSRPTGEIYLFFVSVDIYIEMAVVAAWFDDEGGMVVRRWVRQWAVGQFMGI
ncbi:hypothetical protein V6N13_077375 [Hibiscus sabdariffa]